MQTFLPNLSYLESAKSLDSRRLNKQKVECLQIYNAVIGLRLDPITDEVLGQATGWINHPAVRMWKKYPGCLMLYSWHIAKECERRNINDHRGLLYFFERRMNRHPFIIPNWWTDPDIRQRIAYTHQCNLIRKDAEYYKPLFPNVSIGEAFKTDYYWPV